MKRKTFLMLSFSVAFYTSQIQAQVWDSITQFNQVISDLQTFDGKLFITGGFTKNNASNCYWSAYYSGNTITGLTNPVGGGGIRKADVFNGTDLYVVDGLEHGGAMGVGLWNGSTWIDGGSTNYSHGVIYADGNNLYVSSDDGKVRKKTGGGSFASFYNFTSPEGLSCIIRYNSLLIFAGTFTSIGGVPANNIAAWNGTTWQPLGAGIAGGVKCMAVFNNELYVAGGLTAAGGSVVKNIAKWNGTSWLAVGGGVTSTCYNGIREMKTYGTNLFVVGDFTKMGTVNTSNVAMWNGSQWKGLGLVHADAFVNCIEVYNNQLYVGTFDFAHSHLFRLNGAVGINESSLLSSINVFPNPSSGKFQVQLNHDREMIGEFRLFNIDGKEICNIGAQFSKIGQWIDLTEEPTGIYFLEYRSGEGLVRKKIVVQ